VHVCACVLAMQPNGACNEALPRSNVLCCVLCSYDAAGIAAGSSPGSAGTGHITNYAQNVDGPVWDLDMLRNHLGKDQGQCGGCCTGTCCCMQGPCELTTWASGYCLPG
jgi:hypothetical protein